MIDFKDTIDEARFFNVHPVLAGLFLGCVIPWLNMMGVERPVVTSTIRGRLPWSKSDTHLEGRAIDVRVKDWPDGLAEAFESKFNTMFAEKYGAIGSQTGSKRFVVLHGFGDKRHLHIQVRRGLAFNALLEDI